MTVSSLVEKHNIKQKVLMDKMKIMSSKKGKGQHDPAGDDLNSEVKKPGSSLVVYRQGAIRGYKLFLSFKNAYDMHYVFEKQRYVQVFFCI